MAQALTDQDNREVVAQEKPIGGTSYYKIGKLFKMIAPEFRCSKVEKNPNGFIDEVNKNIYIMVLTSIEKVELATYELKHVAQVRYKQWKNNREVEAGRIEWETFNSASLEMFFLRE